MKYLFILGRNIPLSIQEVFSFLKRKGIKVLESKENKNALLVDVDKKLQDNSIEFLGGVIAIGEVINEPGKQELYFGTSNKLNYVIWDFSDKTPEFSDYLKKRFRKEKLKATEKKLSKEMSSQSGEKYGVVASKLINEQYFVFDDYFGRITQKCDYKKLEKRDMKKPVRRSELSISPRLSKIMINLSEVKENGTLLDAFCGIGVILSEALLQNLEVIGIDIDKDAIEGAKENLHWLKAPSAKYKLINGNSKKVSISNVDVLVSEPDLGEMRKKSPTEDFEKLIIGVMNNLKKNISGKIVFTAPNFQTHKERISCNIENILSKTGLKLVKGPFTDYRKGQIVGRDIFVLSK